MTCNVSKMDLLGESPVVSLEAQLKSHLAWRDNLSVSEIESTLLNSPYYTFILSESDREGFYRLSFLERDNKVHHHRVVIVQNDRGDWGFLNGSHIVFPTIDELIPYSIGCTAGTCRPCV